MFYHPLPHRIFIYVASLLFAILSIVGPSLTYYFFELSVQRSGSELYVALSVNLLILISWLYTIRCTYLSYLFLKTIKYKIRYDELGASIENSNCDVRYRWDELANYKEYNDMDILSILDTENKPIVMLWKYSPSFNEFVKEWSVKSGI